MLDKKVTDDLEIFAKKIMENEGITDYNLNIEGQTGKGVNYGSEIVFFNVTTKTGKKYNFVMKTTRRSEALRRDTEDGIADRREMHMYCEVFPALRQMLSESKSEYQLENIPKTFLVNTEYQHETAIMLDLRSAGYKLKDTKETMNMEHAQTVLTNYGKFHAASMALRIKNPQLFNSLTQDMDNIFGNFTKNEKFTKMFQGYVESALNVLKDEGHLDITEKLKNLPKEVPYILGLTADEKDRVVITHGDCWINNMMFKYQDTEDSKLSGFCFLDFQLSSFGSPATDLSYFLYSSLGEDIVKNQMDQLLEYYYDSLAVTLRNLGIEPKEVFTYDQLMKHWKKYSKSGLVMSSAVIKLQMADRTAGPDVIDAEKGVNWEAFKVDKVENEDVYRKRVVAVYEHYTKTCLS